MVFIYMIKYKVISYRITSNAQISSLLQSDENLCFVNIWDDDDTDENDNYIRRLKYEESKWGIFQGVKNEWEKTFEKLLEYHNTQDLKTISTSIFRNKPTLNDELHKTDALGVKELDNWMVPRLKPPLWKKYLCLKRYEQESLHYDAVKTSLFETESGTTETNLARPETASTQKGIDKQKFLNGIIKQLRKGNKEVY